MYQVHARLTNRPRTVDKKTRLFYMQISRGKDFHTFHSSNYRSTYRVSSGWWYKLHIYDLKLVLEKSSNALRMLEEFMSIMVAIKDISMVLWWFKLFCSCNYKFVKRKRCNSSLIFVNSTDNYFSIFRIKGPFSLLYNHSLSA